MVEQLRRVAPVAVLSLLSFTFLIAPDSCQQKTCITQADCPPTRQGQTLQLNYCQKDPGACLARGVCAPRPTRCAAALDPVCGCDGQTYVNEQCAAENGISLAATEACAADQCRGDRQCPPLGNQLRFCMKLDGSCGEGIGVCVLRPWTCGQTIRQVCGCDGQTYRNAECARAAGVSVAFTGACSPCDEPAGNWHEVWEGIAAFDGDEISGESDIVIQEDHAAYAGVGTDSFDPSYSWSGPVSFGNHALRWDYADSQEAWYGFEECTLVEPECDTLVCNWETTNGNGLPNSAGSAVWTRQ